MKTDHGLVLGKFLPPHNGHRYLIEFARSVVKRLTIIVETRPSDEIPGDIRHQWIRELFPHDQVLRLTDENPQSPDEHPDFWRIWKESLRNLIPVGPDIIFASEEYGTTLAKILGARFIPVDLDRSHLPISGTAVRRDPFSNWEYLPEKVRLYYLKRICVFGPESTGKSTLVRQLASHFKTIGVQEYARGVLERNNGKCKYEDISLIGRGQKASEEALAVQANRYLFCDTDLLSTTLWSRRLFQKVPAWLEKEAMKQSYHLTLLCAPDLPWVNDTVRILPNESESFFSMCKEALEKAGRPFTVIRGNGDSRFQQGLTAVIENSRFNSI
jgi:HTH-type transcriptional regulator, transcriptional repressor of NAD biosynthesis genes